MSDPTVTPTEHESLARGLAQSARGEAVDLGDFTQYADLPPTPSSAVSAPDLDAIRARADAATPGPWSIEYDNADSYEGGIDDGDFPYRIIGPANVCALSSNVTDEWREHYGHTVSEVSELTDADAAFIAHAREDVPALLAALAAAHAETERLREALETIAGATTIADAVPDVREFARAALAAAPSETMPVYEVSPGAFMTVEEPTGTCEATSATHGVPCLLERGHGALHRWRNITWDDHHTAPSETQEGRA